MQSQKGAGGKAWRTRGIVKAAMPYRSPPTTKGATTMTSEPPSNIIEFPFSLTRSDLSPEDMLRAIADEKPEHVFVLAWPSDGTMPTYHSSTGDGPTVLFRLQQFIHKYYNGDFFV
jgi:hypothetical protein